MMKITCLGDAFIIISQVCCTVKNRMAMVLGITAFISACCIGSAAAASLATITVFTPRVLIQSCPCPWTRRSSIRNATIFGVFMLKYLHLLNFMAKAARFGRTAFAAPISAVYQRRKFPLKMYPYLIKCPVVSFTSTDSSSSGTGSAPPRNNSLPRYYHGLRPFRSARNKRRGEGRLRRPLPLDWRNSG